MDRNTNSVEVSRDVIFKEHDVIIKSSKTEIDNLDAVVNSYVRPATENSNISETRETDERFVVSASRG